MPPPWVIPANFDGAKFRARYNLTREQFWVLGNLLFLKPGISIADDPPVIELNDPQPEQNRRLAQEQLSETPAGQLIRALAAVLLTEINNLRAAVIPPLPPRTLQQLKTAIINRIDDGTAD
jgi:hypothetical protein